MDVLSTATQLASIDVERADRDALFDALRHVTRLRRLTDVVEMRANLRLAELAGADPSLSPEHVNAEATQRSLRKATDSVQRATRSSVAPVFVDAVAAGDISAEHLDVFVRGVRSLSSKLRSRLLEMQHALAAVAATSTVEEFQQRVRAEVRHIEGDDGKDRLAQQKRANRVRTWTDPEGMWNLHGRFDPETALPMIEALRRATESLFHGEHPEDAPEDPLAKQQWLQALALARLITGQGAAKAGDPLFTVVIDERTFTTGRRHPESRVDIGGELEIPIEVLRSWSVRAKFIGVVIDADGKVVTQGAPVSTVEQVRDSLLQPVDLDRARTRRHADRAQQAAMRAMYRHCAIPGCTVPVSRTEIHHIQHWEHGGTTDLSNLLPVCRHHHDRIHHDGWTLELAPDRSLIVRRKGVTLMSTGPPREQWAA